MNRLAALLMMLCIGLATLAPQAPAQDAPTQRPRRTVNIPPGFILVETGGIKAICEPADRAAIEAALSSIGPTTAPATMPADLVERLASARPQILQRIAADYQLADTKPLEPHLDRLSSDLARLQTFHPPLFYLCTTEARLKSMLVEGRWSTPEIYYNKLSDELVYRESVPLTVERPMDDTIVAVVVGESEGARQMADKLRTMAAETRLEVQRMVSGRSMFLVQATFIDAVMKEVFEPLQLPLDQQWLGVGAAGITSADYASEVIGTPRNELLLLISAELRRNPVRMRTIDLLNPAGPNDVKREYAAAYADAYRRKSMRAAGKLIEPNRQHLPAVVASLRQKPCTSGADLLARIRSLTGLDLAADAAAN